MVQIIIYDEQDINEKPIKTMRVYQDGKWNQYRLTNFTCTNAEHENQRYFVLECIGKQVDKTGIDSGE